MKKLLSIALLSLVGLTFGQEDESKFNVTGSVDAYFKANLSSSNDGANNATGNSGDFSSFNNDSGFSAGLANVNFTYEGEIVGFVADFAYGPRMDSQGASNTIGDPDANEAGFVNEAYVYWNASENVRFIMGRFNSWMGYETMSAANNFHYSMSHMFTYSARNFNGLIAMFDLGNSFNAGFGLMNPAEVTVGNDTGNYSIAGGISYKETTGFSFLESEDASYYDFKTALDVSEDFNIKFNLHIADFGYDFDNPSANIGTTWTAAQVDAVTLVGAEGFTSVSVYPQLKSTDNMSWGMRLEYMEFNASDDLANNTTVFTPTFTARYSVGDLTIIPELRLDSASEDIFTDADGEATDGLAAFNLAAVYTF